MIKQELIPVLNETNSEFFVTLLRQYQNAGISASVYKNLVSSKMQDFLNIGIPSKKLS